MRRNNYRKYIQHLLSLAIAFLAIGAADSFAQSQLFAPPSYTVLSSNSKEVVISIHPEYHIRTVTDETTGENCELINFTGGSSKGIAIGAPSAQRLELSLLIPSKESARFQIVSVEYEPARSGILAPVPNWIPGTDEFKTRQPHYQRNGALYNNPAEESVSLGPISVYRTAYTQTLRLEPVQFDAGSKQIRLIKSMTVKVTFAESGSKTTPYPSSLSKQEAELFSTVFINGNTSEFYHAAASEVTKALPARNFSAKENTLAEPDAKWLLVTTNDQGVYSITPSSLSHAGITTIDPSTIQLFGYGGSSIPEDVDSLSGELHECAIDVSTGSDGSFAEARFYEPGLNEWYYNPEAGKTPLYWLYHLLNPFTSSGHYLLKIGGSAASKRIATHADNPASPLSVNTVPTVVIHEDEERFEDPGISRDFMGEEIPRGRDVTVSLPDLPGYTSDSTVMRPGFNSHDFAPHTFNISINGTTLDPLLDPNSLYTGSEQFTIRNWGSEILASNILRAQNNSITLSATSSQQDSKYWLNWVEIFYRRQATLSAGQITFYVLADGRGFNFNFSDATSAETWDVSDPWNPVKIASSNGASMTVGVQGDANGFRQFMAFNTATLKTPVITSTGPLTLRNGICQSGAEDIIVTPAAFLDQAKKLANQRTMGGQATEPLSVAVVTVEDITREFGYGSPDYSAIRDFLAYMFRHTTANNTIRPSYLTLFANGHCDYRNKVTQLPIGVPIHETWKYGPTNRLECVGFRGTQPDYVPDDPFFVRLTPGSARMDMAVGRVTVHDANEADAFVSKVIKYETSSDEGQWRSRATFICDDRYADRGLEVQDGLEHLIDTKEEIVYVPQRVIQNEVFGVAYPNTFTSAGRRKPEMEKAIIDAFNSGSALISWVGHGNPSVWAHEAILTVPSTINKLTNFNRLAFVTTATCDFSRYDNYASPISGGVQLITKSDGGAIGSLGTSRSVSPDETAPTFYQVLFQTGCSSLTGTAHVGLAYIPASTAGSMGMFFYIMGDPTQRIIFPRQYVAIDSINGIPFNESDAPRTIAALSQLTISGHIANSCDGSDIDPNFNGNVAVTLFDAPTHVSVTTTFLEQEPKTDTWDIDGPILYRGSSTVNGGKFRTSFIVSKDIKFDTNRAKISMLAYSDNFHSALGATTNLRINGIDTSRASDHSGPGLTVYIGSRAFHSGDVVPVNSKIIVDVSDISGLNSSTASIGHSFVAWTDDSTAGMIDLASTYVSKQDDYTSGTSEQQAQLPVGTHMLRVRAFDALDNPTFAEVQFTARDEQPYALYDTRIVPNPVRNDKSLFTFLQPSAPESPVDVTITIYTIIGAKVRELSAQSISQNAVSIPFDGRDDSGMILADGAYVYRIAVRERLTNAQTTVGGTFVIVRN
ncbi:MAG: type IX secretion system sortase PorU [Bacteroidota bacterium]|nr:type IX secretion system sortase PorU [Bacteroidota bacterium]